MATASFLSLDHRNYPTIIWQQYPAFESLYAGRACSICTNPNEAQGARSLPTNLGRLFRLNTAYGHKSVSSVATQEPTKSATTATKNSCHYIPAGCDGHCPRVTEKALFSQPRQHS